MAMTIVYHLLNAADLILHLYGAELSEFSVIFPFVVAASCLIIPQLWVACIAEHQNVAPLTRPTLFT